MYSINALKTWDTHDGGGYQGNLLRDGKIVGSFHNEGNGGDTLIDFFTKKGKEVVRNREEEKLFNDHVKTLPDVVTDMTDPHDASKPFIYKMNGDAFVAQLVEALVRKKWFKKECAKKVLFRLTTDKPETWRTLNDPYDEKAKKYLADKYGSQIAEIANETKI